MFRTVQSYTNRIKMTNPLPYIAPGLQNFLYIQTNVNSFRHDKNKHFFHLEILLIFLLFVMFSTTLLATDNSSTKIKKS